MGEKKRRRVEFLSRHPLCCFCGGMRPATEIDHVPPKIVLVNKQAPDMIRFPACGSCNRASSQADQALAMVSFTSPRQPEGDEARYFQRIVSGVANNSNRTIHELLDNCLGHRELNKRFERHFGVMAFATRLGPVGLHQIRVVGAKFGFAYFYKETGAMVPPAGGVVVDIITNRQIWEDAVPEACKLDMPFDDLTRHLQKKEQILYRFSLLEDRSAGIFQLGLQKNILLSVVVTIDRRRHSTWDDVAPFAFTPGDFVLPTPLNEQRFHLSWSSSEREDGCSHEEQ